MDSSEICISCAECTYVCKQNYSVQLICYTKIFSILILDVGIICHSITLISESVLNKTPVLLECSSNSSFLVGWCLIRYLLIQEATLKQLVYRNEREPFQSLGVGLEKRNGNAWPLISKIKSNQPLTNEIDRFSDESKRRASYWMLCTKKMW
jgi:hypothetical protein